MFPQDDKFVCNKCGYEKPKEGKSIVVKKQLEKDIAILEGNIDILPKTRVKCPKCDNNEAYWVLRQMRGSDEPETRIYTCTKCNHRWRAN